MSPQPLHRVLIAGASGVVGQAAVRHFQALADWEVIGLSRRAPHGVSVAHLAADLFDSACIAQIQALPPITHVVYAALYEAPGLLRLGAPRSRCSATTPCWPIASKGSKPTPLLT